jgi:phage shock protein A
LEQVKENESLSATVEGMSTAQVKLEEALAAAVTREVSLEERVSSLQTVRESFPRVARQRHSGPADAAGGVSDRSSDSDASSNGRRSPLEEKVIGEADALIAAGEAREAVLADNKVLEEQSQRYEELLTEYEGALKQSQQREQALNEGRHELKGRVKSLEDEVTRLKAALLSLNPSRK